MSEFSLTAESLKQELKAADQFKKEMQKNAEPLRNWFLGKALKLLRSRGVK